MSDLVPFNDDQLPAHIAELFGDTSNDDLMGGVSGGFPVIHIKGKVWSITDNGVNTPLTRVDESGDEYPVNAIEVVIVKANPNVSKVYYKDGFEEGSQERPTCYSNDGVRPAEDALEPQADACLACPLNAWGSRVTENGSKAKACADVRRICVASLGDLDKPMLLRVPAGSLKELVAYGELLKKRSVPYQAVLTRISFDPTVAHPKLLFKARAWLNEQQMKQVAELMRKDIVQQILGLPTPADKRPQVATAPKTQASVSGEDVEAALTKKKSDDKPQLAVASEVKQATKSAKKDEVPAKKRSNKLDSLIQEADNELDEILGAHLNAE